MTEPTFKPSEVFLNTVPPLTGTMGHAEREHAAALLVYTCVVNGDEWQAVSPRMLGEAITAAIGNKIEPWFSLNRNPFFRPDFNDLVTAEFARAVMDPPGVDEKKAPVEFTEKGIEAMRRWVRFATPPAAPSEET